MKILLFSNSYDIENSSGSGRLNDLVPYLVSLGHEISILTSTFDYLSGTIRNEYRKRIVTKESQDGYSVYRAWCYDGYNKSYPKRVLTFISFLLSSILGQFAIKEYDVVFVGTPPFFLGIPGIIAAKRKRVPLIYEVRDLWIDVAVELGFVRDRHLVSFLKDIEKYLFRNSEKIITNSPAFKGYIEKTGHYGDKIRFIPNGVNLQDFSPEREDISRELRGKLGLEHKFIVVYTGAHGLANNLDYVLSAAKLISKLDDSICFLLIGDGNYKSRLIERVKSEQISNVVFHDPIKKYELGSYLKVADMGIAVLLPTQMLKTTYPNKVFDYMACGIPVISAIDGVIRQLIEEEKTGIYVDPSKPEELARELIRLKSTPDKLTQMGLNGRRLVMREFDRNRATARLAEEITQLK